MNILVLLFIHIIHVQMITFRQRPPGNPQEGFIKVNDQKPIIRQRFKNQKKVKSTFCDKVEVDTKQCLQCVFGFKLSDTLTCIPDPTFNIQKIVTSNPLLASLDLNAVLGTYNPYCAFINTQTQICKSCYSGFILEQGFCVQNPNMYSPIQRDIIQQPLNPVYSLCLTFTKQGKCQTCYQGSTLRQGDCHLQNYTNVDCNLHQLCLAKVDFCQTYGSDLNCKTCPRGTINVRGVCRVDNKKSLCQQYDDNRRCKRCRQQGVLQMKTGTCSYITPNCQTFDKSYTCIQCKSMFVLKDGDCILVSNIPFLKKDKNCYTWKNGSCIQCKFKYHFVDGKCITNEKQKN